MKQVNLGIEAGAGCGKTTRIVTDIVEGLRQGAFDIDGIAVITFTRKAAGELKSRISLKLQEEIGSGNSRMESQLKNMGNARISTIHSFCEGLLKERPVEAGIDPAFSVIDDGEQEEFLQEVYDEWLEVKLDEEQDFFRELAVELGKDLRTPDYSFNSKDRSFVGILRTALEHRELDLFVPKKPESAKVILKRFAAASKTYLDQADDHTVKKHIKDYIDVLKEAAKGKPEDYLEALGKFPLGNKGPRNLKDFRDEWKTFCKQYVDDIAYSIKYPAIKKLYENTNRMIQDFIAFYRQTMREQGKMDFSEILCKTDQLLASSREARDYFKQKFSKIFVDEFQDTDPLQVKILFYLAEKEGEFCSDWEDVKLSAGKLYIVGDPKQSIFRFRRADIEMYTRAMERLTAGKGGEKEFLTVNYRSSEKVIGFVNGFFKDRIAKPADGMYQADYVELNARPKAGKKGGVVFVEPAGDLAAMEEQKKDEARSVEAKLTATWISKNAGSGKPYAFGDIMLLFKTKSNMQQTADYLEQLEIPYEMVGASSYFGRAEILDMANFLAVVANPLDTVRIVAALKGPFFSLTDKDLFSWRQDGNYFEYRDEGLAESDHPVGQAMDELRELHERSRTETAYTILSDMLEQKGVLASYMVSFRGKHRVMNVLKAVELLKDMGKVPFCKAANGFVEKLQQNIEMPDFAPRAGQPDAVQFLTVHKAKGLEQRVVYLADCTSNNIIGNDVYIDNESGKMIYTIHKDYSTPDSTKWKEKDQRRDEAESERLRYVAATRAKELLLVNRVPCKQEGKTFAAHFTGLGVKADTVQIDVSKLVLTPGKHAGNVKPRANGRFAGELKKITDEIPRQIETLSHPSMTVGRPSTVVASAEQISVQVLYDPEAMRYNVEGVSASEMGTLAHKMMELNPVNLKKAAETLIKNEKLNIDPAELVKVVKSLQKKDFEERIGRAKQVLREVPLKFTGSDGICYDGSIDLLFEEEDGWVVVDYKTVIVPNAEAEQQLIKKYESQLALYCEGLKQMGLSVKETILVSR